MPFFSEFDAIHLDLAVKDAVGVPCHHLRVFDAIHFDLAVDDAV